MFSGKRSELHQARITRIRANASDEASSSVLDRVQRALAGEGEDHAGVEDAGRVERGFHRAEAGHGLGQIFRIGPEVELYINNINIEAWAG